MQARHRLCKGRNSWLRQQIRRQLWRGTIKAPRCWQRDREHKGPARWRYLSKYLHRTHSKRAMLRRLKKKKNQSLYLHPRLASSWGPDWYLCFLIFSTSCQNLAAHLSRMLRMISSFPVGLSDRVLYLQEINHSTLNTHLLCTAFPLL